MYFRIYFQILLKNVDTSNAILLRKNGNNFKRLLLIILNHVKFIFNIQMFCISPYNFASSQLLIIHPKIRTPLN
mgnify:CR=1 FL=1